MGQNQKGATKMTEQKIPDYETIKAAVAGEKWALEKVVDCFSGEIDKLSTVTKQLPDDTTEKEIDEDLRQTLILKLLEAIPTFPLDEAEGNDNGEA